MDFTDDTVLRLIREYEKYPVLWDPEDKFYKLNNRKKDAWNAICSVLEADADVLKKKMNSILNSYRRERQKVLSKTSGTRSKDEVRPSLWFAYEALSFLHSKYQPRRTTNMIEFDGDSYEDMNCEISPRKRPQINDIVSSKKPMKTKIPYDYEIGSAWNTLQSSTDEKKNKDQFDSFGEYIAERLRQMDLNTCIHVKKAINDIIFEAELINSRSVPLQQPPNIHLSSSSWTSKQSPTHSYSTTSNTSLPSPTSSMSKSIIPVQFQTDPNDFLHSDKPI